MTVFLGATIVGLTLGLLGSGGSILTVPILIYVLGHDQKIAIAESMAIVSGLAFLGVLAAARRGQIDLRSALFFGVSGIAGTTLGAELAGFLSGSTQFILFAVVMLAAAGLMLRTPPNVDPPTTATQPAASARSHALLLVIQGTAIGILTALVGVGGGFLVIPALVIGVRLPMRMAVGTSLAVVTLNSTSGLLNYLSMGVAVDWSATATFLLVGAVGTLAGSRLGAQIPQPLLKRGFGALLFGLALFVLLRELPAHFGATSLRTFFTTSIAPHHHGMHHVGFSRCLRSSEIFCWQPPSLAGGSRHRQ